MDIIPITSAPAQTNKPARIRRTKPAPPSDVIRFDPVKHKTESEHRAEMNAAILSKQSAIDSLAKNWRPPTLTKRPYF